MSLKANDTNQHAALPAPRQGFAVPGSGYGAVCGEKRVSFQRTGLHASRILVAMQGCKAVAMRFNYSQLLLDLREKGVYCSYTRTLIDIRRRFQRLVYGYQKGRA